MVKKPVMDIIDQITDKLFIDDIYKNRDEAEVEAWWFLEKITQKSQAELIEEDVITLSPDEHKQLEDWIFRRTKKHEPIQYILGSVPFCGIEIYVEPPILIPRPETEEWCAWLIERLGPGQEKEMLFVDLGAGSGCITLALATALPFATVIGVDINRKAIMLCERNKTHLALNNAIFLESNLYERLDQYKGIVDVIVSNLPYISEEEFSHLSKEVTEWEDKTALVAGENGFGIHKKIIAEASLYLKNGGMLVLEFGKGQAEEMKKLYSNARFKNIEIHKDLENNERWITAVKLE